jgi:parallel beta-helix repeat protein
LGYWHKTEDLHLRPGFSLEEKMKRNWLLLALVAWVSATLYINDAQADTTFVAGGTYASNVTWTQQGSPYIIQGYITFRYARLTLEPGTTVKFAPNTGISFGDFYYMWTWGELVANGTPDSLITFTSLNDSIGGWNGLYFERGSGGNGPSSLTNCVIEKAVSSNLYCNLTNQPTVSHCVIRQSAGSGIFLNGSYNTITDSQILDDSIGVYCSGASPTIQSSTISGNRTYGVYLGGASSPDLKGNHYSNNGLGIAVEGGLYYMVSNNLISWHNDNQEPYILLNNIVLRYTTLTIEPGTTVKFAPNTGISFGDFYYMWTWGELVANGTPDSLITFTPLNDSIGGWNGLYFERGSGGNGPSSLTNCVIEKAASSNLYCNLTNQPTVSHCVIRQSAGSGIFLNGSNNTITDSQILDDSIGVYCSGASPTIQSSTISGNRTYGIYIDGFSSPDWANNGYSNNGYDIALNGGIYYNTTLTWHNGSNAPYTILGDIIIRNARLTIEPGVVMRFASNAGLQLGDSPYYSYFGELIAQGTPDSQIVFTSLNDSSNGWDGIYFNSESDWMGHTSSMDYCVVEKAGQSGWGLRANLYCNGTGQPTISNCIFKDAPGCGIYLSSSPININNSQFINDSIGVNLNNSSPMAITSCSFNSCTACGIYLASTTFPQLIGNYYENNARGVVIQGGPCYTVETLNNNGGEPYYVQSDILLRFATITVQPGTHIRFDGTAGIQVGDHYWDGHFAEDAWGVLNAAGTADSIIVFTSSNDSIRGWNGIYFHPNNSLGGHTSTLSHCIIEKAGQGGYGASSNIYCLNTYQPSINDCVIKNAAGTGIYLDGSTLNIARTAILDNDSNGVFINGGGGATIGDSITTTCQLFGNGNYNIYNNTANTINARYNYWGTTDSSEIENKIYDQVDNSSKGRVQFSLWTVLAHDVACQSILAPTGVVALGTVITPMAVVRNPGQTYETFSVIFKIGGFYCDTAYVNEPLAPGAVDTVSFDPWTAETMLDSYSYAISCSTALANDQFLRNDVVRGTVAIGNVSEPVIYSYTPNHGGNIGSTTLRINGHNFLQGAKTLLKALGRDDIYSDSNLTFVPDSSSIIAVFDLIDRPIGTYDLVIINPDSGMATMRNAFSIELGYSNRSINIVGRSDIRVNRPARFELVISNNGNTDLFAQIVLIRGIPFDATLQPLFEFEDPPLVGDQDTIDWSQLPVLYPDSDGLVLPLYFPYIPANSTYNFPFNLTISTMNPINLQLSSNAEIFSPLIEDNEGLLLLSWSEQKDIWNCAVRIGKVIAQDILNHNLNPYGECVQSGTRTILDIQGQMVENASTPIGIKAIHFVNLWGDLAHSIIVCTPLGEVPIAIIVADAWEIYRVVSGGSEDFLVCQNFIGNTIRNIIALFPRSSLDPNELVGPFGYGDLKYISKDAKFNYIIYFENVDSATACAESIWVCDTLSQDVDWETLEFGDVNPGAGPDSIRPNFTIQRDFNPYTGVIRWGLFGINLPPDTMPYWGEGWVSYSVKPKPDLPTGTRIENIASIKFDENDWILAPMDSIPIFNTIDADPPVSQVHAFSDSVGPTQPFVVSWTGSDSGAGIVSYRIFMADSIEGFPGNAFSPWQTTSDTSAIFDSPQRNHIYSFYSVATDGVGYQEVKHDTVEAQIKITGPPPCSYVVGDANNSQSFTGLDVTYSVRYFKGGPLPPYSCECTPGYIWYVAGDVNGSCTFSGLDVTYMVRYFKGGPGPVPCADCPPGGLLAPLEPGEVSTPSIQPKVVPTLKAKAVIKPSD